jgi:type VI secretion system protein ImpA
MTLDLDIPSLLTPFEQDFRGGTDLRADDDPNNAYRQIRDARNEAREEERQADLNGESSSRANHLWRDVWENGQEYLKSSAKDLEIVAYMIEASIRLGGFGGLAQSLTLTAELMTSFWGELLPTPDEDGIETTLRPISRLNGDVITYPLMRVPMTDDTSIGVFVMWQHTQAKQLETLTPEEKERRISAGSVTLERFNRAVAETSDLFFQNLQQELQDAQKALQSLIAVFEERVSDAEAPNLSKFQKSIEDGFSILEQVAGHRLSRNAPASTTEVNSAATSSSHSSRGAVSQGSSGGQITSRNDALELLEKAARWFEEHEPQSILPSEIRKAIRRGRMTPMELYADLIADADVRRQLFKDVGIPFPEEN